MKNIRMLTVLLANLIVVGYVYGHGIPINLSSEDGRLVASHPSNQTFAPPVFGQPDESGDYERAEIVPGLGIVIPWDVPSFDIYGLAESASLSIEVLARPAIGSSPADHRLIWYWNPTTEMVEQSPVRFHLHATGPRLLTMNPEDQVAPEPFLLAETLAGQIGSHTDGLLFYSFEINSGAPAGVYGFFARLISNSYAPSDPFLIVFNYNVEYARLADASLDIYEAATLPGDFDLDDDVDGRDFLEWQRLVGSTTRTVADASLNGVVDAADLQIWQQDYGNTFEESSFLPVTSVPEPECLMTLVQALAIFGSLFRQSK